MAKNKQLEEWQKYQNSSSLYGERFPIRAIPSYAKETDQCILTNLPSIRDIEKYYNDGGTVNWLIEVVRCLCNFSSISVDEFQETMAAETIMQRYGSFKPTDIMLFSAKFMGGDYESFYGRFDIHIITKSLWRYQEYRNTIISRDERGKANEERAKHKVDGVACFNQYLQLLQKAVYGDEMAMSALRLNTYEDVVRCCAKRVQQGSFPDSIRQFIKPDYLDLFDDVVKPKNLFSEVE